MILECPKCGAQNSIPEPCKQGIRYRCGKCNTRLTDAARPSDSQLERDKSSKFSLLNWFKDRENQLIFLLASLTLILYLLIIPYGTELIKDERYYVPEARSIIHEGELTYPEHPSLGKLLIASGISVFGDNPWGWRIPSVVFAVSSVVLFYFICRRLAGKSAAFLASFLLIFESLIFIVSGLAMLDVFSLTFVLLAFMFYLRDRYVFSGVALALSALCKMAGLFGILVILAHWLISKRRQSPQSIIFLLVSTLVTFVLLMPLLDFAATREWLNPIERILDVSLRYSSERGWYTAQELAQHGVSYPWDWILSPSLINYYSTTLHYLATISKTVWIFIIPSVGYLLYGSVKNKSDVFLFPLIWFAAAYLPWILLVLFVDRVTYIHYFYPAVVVICMAIGFALQRLWKSSLQGRLATHRRLVQITIISYLAIHVFFFWVSTPIRFALHSYLFS